MQPEIDTFVFHNCRPPLQMKAEECNLSRPQYNFCCGNETCHAEMENGCISAVIAHRAPIYSTSNSLHMQHFLQWWYRWDFNFLHLSHESACLSVCKESVSHWWILETCVGWVHVFILLPRCFAHFRDPLRFQTSWLCICSAITEWVNHQALGGQFQLFVRVAYSS